MKYITCKYCGAEIAYNETHPPLSECPNCLSAVDIGQSDGKLETPAELNAEEFSTILPDGFSLIFQKNGAELTFKHAAKMILGRDNLGRELFSKIPQISRSHLLVEFSDNRYNVTDLNSSNGTFIGVEKINCKTNPAQPLKDGEILFLGREAFLVKINYKKKTGSELKKKQAQIRVNMDSIPRAVNTENRNDSAGISVNSPYETVLSNPEKEAEIYVCKNCYNYKSEKKEFTCPLCNTYNS